MATTNPSKIRVFVPVTVDQFQSDDYTLTRYTWTAEDGLIAHFASGKSCHSIYNASSDPCAALIKAGQSDPIDRVREIHY